MNILVFYKRLRQKRKRTLDYYLLREQLVRVVEGSKGRKRVAPEAGIIKIYDNRLVVLFFDLLLRALLPSALAFLGGGLLPGVLATLLLPSVLFLALALGA